MAEERAPRREAERAQKLRVVRGRPTETPLIDLSEGVKLYLDLLRETEALQDITEGLRGRILRAMERTGVDDFFSDGVHAIRQIRHFPPRLDEDRATRILKREGRLQEVMKAVLDAEKARQVLDELYVQNRISKEEMPYTRPREVEALIVRSEEEEG